MSKNELNSAARDLTSVRQMIEELQAEAEALTDKLKAAMGCLMMPCFPSSLIWALITAGRCRHDGERTATLPIK